MKPAISFVVPLYNKQSFIADCLSSLILQTLRNIEIVVVDDASTDESVEVVKHFAKNDKRIKLYCLKKNVGRSEARNYGNAKAKADIICVNDADDKSAFERAGMVRDIFKEDKSVGMVYSSFHVSDIYGRLLGKITAEPFDYERVKRNGATHIGHSTMAYRKEWVRKVKYTGGKYSKLGIDDWKLQMDLYRAGCKFYHVEKPLVIYRQLSNTITELRDKNSVCKVKISYLKNLDKGVGK